MLKGPPDWLEHAVFYQIYPQSFKDSNGDGIGDLNGIIERLDYIQSLGVTALWLNPCYVSPFLDAGYDVVDYFQIAPRYGTNADFKRLLKQAHQRGIRLCLDLVPGHTSIEHPWFKASCKHGRNKYSDRYIWTTSMWDRGDQSLPVINGYAERDGNYAVNFFYSQPALNYGFAKPDKKHPYQQSVEAPGPMANRRELMRIMDYWLNQGVDGFRVDMAGTLVKNDPGRRETIKLWRNVCKWMQDKYPDAVLISEWGNPQEAISAGFHIDFMMHFGVKGYENLLLNEDCFFRRNGGKGIQNFLRPYLQQISKTKSRGNISIPSANHDFKRLRSDGRTMEDLKVIFTFLLSWPGVPFIYYGDEIGMRFMKKLSSKEGGYDRTGSRTPMQWDNGQNAGFSCASPNQLYLPIDRHKKRPTVNTQEKDPRSLLNHVKKLLTLRKSSRALQANGELIPLFAKTTKSPFVYQRKYQNESFLVALNPSNEPIEIQIDQMRVSCGKPEIGYGVKVIAQNNGTTLKLNGVSYGIFRL